MKKQELLNNESHQAMIKSTLLAAILLSAILVAQSQIQSEPKDISELRKAAEQGDARKQYELGNRYYIGKGVAKDQVEAMKWWRKAAERGDAEMQRGLAFQYWLVGDAVESAKWYLKAAEQGNAVAQSNLGRIYEEGRGVPKSYAEAAKWFRKSAENVTVDKTGLIPTNATDANSLGNLYEKGLGVPQDYAEAAKWYRKAVEGGYDLGAFYMYFLCSNGKATKKDCTDVARWLTILADQDDSALLPSVRAAQGTNVSRFFLGTLYEKGLGVSQDYAESAKWYRKSADQGNTRAQLSIAILYMTGRGVPQDFVAAHMWVNLAASLETNGEDQKIMAQQRDDLATTMTPTQIAEAQRLARDWKPTNAK